MYKKSNVDRAKEKLANIEKTFGRLRTKLSKNQKIEGKYQTLVDGIKKYINGLKYSEDDLQYAACTQVYGVFAMKKYLKDPTFKDRIKGIMKEIGREYLSDSPQLKFFFDYPEK